MITLPRGRHALAAVAAGAVGALACAALIALAGPGSAQQAIGAVVLAAAVAALVMYAPAASLGLLVVAGPVKSTPVAEMVPVDLAAFALLVVVVAGARAAWTGRDRLFRPGAAPGLMLLFAGWLLIALIWSPAGLAGAGKAWEFTGVSVVAFLAAMLVALSPTAARDLAVALVVVATAVAWFAVDTGHPARPIALPGSTSEIDLGFLTALGVIAIVAYLVPRSPGWWKVAWALPLAIIVPKLVGAGSRGALLATGLALAAVLVTQAAAWPRRRAAVAGGVVALVAAMAVAWIMSPDAARTRYAAGLAGLGSGGVSGAVSTAGGRRSEYMDRATEMMWSTPWGTGTGGYTALTGWKWPHNIVVETGAELGVVGLALLVALVAVVVGRLISSMRRRPDDALVLGIGLLVVPLVLSMSSFDLNGNRILWIMLGLCTGLAAVRFATRRTP